MGGLWLAQGSPRGPGASGQGLAGALLLDLRGKLGRQCWGQGDRELLRASYLLPDMPWPRTVSPLPRVCLLAGACGCSQGWGGGAGLG